MISIETTGNQLVPSIDNLALGRLPSFDIRDTRFQMRALLQSESPPPPEITKKYWWNSGYWGNQGNLPHCVGFAWAHFLESSPITHPDKQKTAVENPSYIYHQAQLIDEWAGEDYDGTSVRAGVKFLQSRGYIESYVWAWDLKTVITALLTKGPVVVGTNWYESMFKTDADGFLNINGHAVGGHATLWDGINIEKKIIRGKNSWGRGWGAKGNYWLTFKSAERLIQEQGEVCLAIEKKIQPTN